MSTLRQKSSLIQCQFFLHHQCCQCQCHTSSHSTDVPTSKFKSGYLCCLSSDSFYSSKTANPMHPQRKVNCGGTTYNLLRTVQLKTGGCCSMEYKDPSYRLKRPLASILSTNMIILRTGNCHFAKNKARSQKLRIQLLPMQYDPTLHDDKWLNKAARLVKLKLFIVAGATGLTTITVTARL